jgi:hypothetical protein
VPLAANCWLVPSAIEGFCGDNEIEDSVTAATVSVVEPVIDPNVAVMVVGPAPRLVASPFVPALLLTAATVKVLDVQVTVVVMFCVLPSV